MLSMTRSSSGSKKKRASQLYVKSAQLLLFCALVCPLAYGQSSTWCHFETGILAGQTINYGPLGFAPLPIGAVCHDGYSFGHVVPAPIVSPWPILDAQLQAQYFSGVVYISQNGAAEFNKAYGMANAQAGMPNTTDTVFLIGSLTKQFTAAAILKLQEAGSVNVGDHICQYIAACPQSWNAITIKDLLNHSSGIPNYITLPQVQQFASVPVTPVQILSWIEPLPLMFLPGTQFYYSNSNYVILGVIIEKVSAKSYADFMQQTFFGPLGMSDTSFSPNVPIDTIGYPLGIAANRFIAYSAGGISTTAADLGSWVERLVFGDTLSALSKNEMFSNSNPAPSECNGGYYGFGWCISSVNGNRLFFHDGDITGFDSAISVVPNHHLVVIMLSNVQDPNIMTKTEQIAASLTH